MDTALGRLARRQDGVFTRADALACGVSKLALLQAVLAGRLLERHPGVYVAATQPPSHASECRAALAAVGPPCALGGRSAGWAWGLPGCDGGTAPHLVVPGDRRYGHLDGVVIRRVAVPRWAVRWRQGWPVTPVEVTVRDLAADLGATDAVREICQFLLLERRTTVERLETALGRGLDGSAALRGILRELDPRFHSDWEAMLFRALRRAGLTPKVQIRLTTSGGQSCYLDLGFPEIRFGIEIDGFLPHMLRFAADRRRNNAVCLELGWVLAHYTVADLVTRLDEVVAEIAAFVARRTAAAA